MKYRYHIHFADNSNPYFSFDMGASEIVKAVNKWVKAGNYNFNNKYTIFDFDHNSRISSTHRGTWVIYKKGKYCDTPLNEYRQLGNAMKFLEKEIQKGA